MTLLLLLRPAKGGDPRGGHFLPEEEFPQVVVEREGEGRKALSKEELETELFDAVDTKISLQKELKANQLKEGDALLRSQKKEVLLAEIRRMEQIIQEDEALLMILTFL